MSDEIEVVIVEVPAEISVAVEEPPDIVVVVSEVGLQGRAGRDGIDGVDGDSVSEQAISGAIADHVADESPHPVYDDGPSFFLLYQNAKV